jgi:hypothetical protein
MTNVAVKVVVARSRWWALRVSLAGGPLATTLDGRFSAPFPPRSV